LNYQYIDRIHNTTKGTKVALALGFFDSVHIGHRKIFEYIVQSSNRNGLIPCALTFVDNPKQDGLMYNYAERVRLIESCGVKHVVGLQFGQVKDMSPIDFLQYCKETLNVSYVACGSDFRFGKHARGDVGVLMEFCNQYNIACDIVDEVMLDGVKVSTTTIRRLVQQGDIEQLNLLLGSPYSIGGIVVHGKGIGRTIAPTINFVPDSTKQLLLEGVYGTHTLIQDVWYKSVTNIGAQPTVQGATVYIETHILDWDGDLYDRYITIRFDKRLRGVVKFGNIEELKAQINKDKQWRLTNIKD
jgi:riboflavin kinase/FMN adenylyltransferase